MMRSILNALTLVLVATLALRLLSPALQEKRKTQAKEISKPVMQADYGKYNFTLTTLDGKKLRLSDYAGKAVLVNIWAPWCGPCRVEMPDFARLYERYHGKGFEILSVAVQTNERDVRSFVEKYKINWPVGLNDEVARNYGSYGLPDNYLFNPDGSLAKHFLGLTREEKLKPLIEESLKRITPRNSR